MKSYADDRIHNSNIGRDEQDDYHPRHSFNKTDYII